MSSTATRNPWQPTGEIAMLRACVRACVRAWCAVAGVAAFALAVREAVRRG